MEYEMDYTVRRIRQDEYPLLEDFLYEAIFVPEGFDGEVPRSIVHDDPKCRTAFEGFGELPDDRAIVAEADGKVIGACWVRTTDEYGHIVHKRGRSRSRSLSPIGVRESVTMMQRMLDELREAGYVRASLSVQKDNPALLLYEWIGFQIVGDGFDETEWLTMSFLGLS